MMMVCGGDDEEDEVEGEREREGENKTRERERKERERNQTKQTANQENVPTEFFCTDKHENHHKRAGEGERER